MYAEGTEVYWEKAKVIGNVKWFIDVKGYGFIGRKGGPLHGDIRRGHRTLKESDPVEFEVVQGAKGPLAANVVVRPKFRLPLQTSHWD